MMTLNIGVVGTGMIGQDHIRRISEVLAGARVVAVTDIDAQRAQAVAQARGAEVFDSADSLIASPKVDAVLVTSYGPAHEEAVLAALGHGKPVFCEKPLTPTAAGCLRIMEAEVAAGRRLVQVGFMRRYDASYRAMKSALDGGGFGAPLMVHCAHRNQAVNDYYVAEMAISDTAIHEIDTMRWLLNDEVKRVRVDKPRRTSLAAAHLQDPLVFIMEMTSGVRVDVEVFVNCQYGYDIRCEVVAETGTVSLADQNVVSYRDGVGHHNAITTDWRERFLGAYDTELQEWILSVKAGLLVGPSTWDGYVAAVVCDAGVAALDRGDDSVEVRLLAKPALYGQAVA